MNTRNPDRQVVDGSDSIVIESTLPPTTSHDLLEAEGATVLVYSHDAALARVIRNVAAERYPIRIINEWASLLEQIGNGTGRIILLDVDALVDDVEDALAQINRCADWLVIVIAAKQQRAQDFMRFWSERRIHRLLIKPAAAGITRLLLESAFARFIELRELHENTDSMEIPHELVAEEDRRHRRRRIWPVAVAAATGLGVIAGVWVFLYGASGTSEPPESTARIATAEMPTQPGIPPAVLETPEENNSEVPPNPPNADPFEDQLANAELAETLGNVVEPAGDNALDYYTEILIAAPDHPVARERLDALLEDQFAAAQENILARDYAAAEQALAHIARANPSGTRLQFLEEQLSLLQAAPVTEVNVEPVVVEAEPVVEEPEPVIPAEPTELQSMLTLLRLRLDEGLLVEPAGDSARDYLERAIDLGAASEDITAEVTQFSEMAVDAITVALSSDNPQAAATILATARDFGSESAELEALQPDVEAALLAMSREEDAMIHSQAMLRVDEGVFIDREDSAVAQLQILRERGADSSLISDLENRLVDALAESTRAAIAAGRWNEADRLLDTFAIAELELPDISALEQQVASARRQEAYLSETVAIGEMTLLEASPAVYPRSARFNEVAGWVDLHFTVALDGTTTDIEVVAAEPEGEFEASAIEALQSYIFEPWEFEERVYQRRVRLRMRFEFD